MNEPLYGYSDMVRQADGSYRYVSADIGTSPMGQAKLFLRLYEENWPEHGQPCVRHLRAVLEESDRRLFEEQREWWYDGPIHRAISWIVKKLNR